jgi:hypothetical protein
MQGWLNHHTIRWARTVGCLALLPLAAVPVDFSQSQTNQAGSSGQARQTLLVPEANRPPDKNDQMRMNEQQEKKVSFDAANQERKKQMDDDTAKLLKLAMELKAEVDKSNKDTLSLGVIRKADDIERLAHSVQVKMKLTIAAR